MHGEKTERRDTMKRVLPWIVILIVFMFSICISASPILPDGLLKLPEDAEVIDVRENPSNRGLEISIVTDFALDKLHDLYVEELKEAEELSITPLPGGYMISATLDGVHHTLMLSETAMDANPVYAGKTSVYAVLTGLDISMDQENEEAKEEGLPWPHGELPGLPELKGTIHKVLKEGGSVYLEITVANSDIIRAYIEDVREAGFYFDTEPEFIDGHVEFFAFRGDNILGFGYGEDDHFVAMEFVQ